MDRTASGQEKNYFVRLVTSVCLEDQGIWYTRVNKNPLA